MCFSDLMHKTLVKLFFTHWKKLKKQLRKTKDILSVVRASDIIEIKAVVSLCWEEANKSVVPEELKKYMPDDEYMEIAVELEKEKPESEKN